MAFVDSTAVQETLQGACCFNQCPPLDELPEHQFLAVILWYLEEATGFDIEDIDPADIQEAARAAWCEINMATLCSIPPDKIKAMILYLAQQLEV